MNTQTEDKLANAKAQGQAQGQAQFDSIREMVEALENAQNDENRDDAERAIHEDALSVEVRSAWLTLEDWSRSRNSNKPADRLTASPAEYRILLCTGGPACQIVGELSEHGEPETAKLQVQDWFTPWTDMRPRVNENESGLPDYNSEPILLAYARCFYFGE